MTAKKYLQQLRILDLKIRQREEQVNGLKSKAFGSGSISGGGERVQTSVAGDKLSENVSKYVDLQAEIESLTEAFIVKKHEIITAIQELDDPRYISILYKRYVEFKKFELIAVEMNYNFDWVRTLHGQALEDFEKTHTNTHLHVL